MAVVITDECTACGTCLETCPTGSIEEGEKYNIVGGFSYYQRAEVKDILAYLKLAQQPADFRVVRLEMLALRLEDV